MIPPSLSGSSAGSATSRRFPLAVVTGLFFVWGFLTCLNDVLIPHLKSVFDLNYVEASLIQFTFFGAYFLMSVPAGKIVARFGYQRGMVIGLATAAAGALLFYPAAARLSYGCFLGALFTLATGITLLQVAANPYVAALGPTETAASRLNLAQAFNSLGTTLAPFFGGWLILAAAGQVFSDKGAEAASVKGPYLGLAITLALFAVVIGWVRLPPLGNVEEKDSEPVSLRGVLGTRHLVLGALGIFLYVGAEVSVGSYLISFMADPGVAGLPPQRAASFVSYFWGGAMVGRFIGSALMQKIPSHRLLAFNAVVAALLCVAGLMLHGHAAMGAVLAIGFFNSIMFPTLFTLGIARLGPLTSKGSSLLVMAIVGGALIPVAMGRAADLYGIHHALFIPALCYLFIVYYGWTGYRPKSAN